MSERCGCGSREFRNKHDRSTITVQIQYSTILTVPTCATDKNLNLPILSPPSSPLATTCSLWGSSIALPEMTQMLDPNPTEAVLIYSSEYPKLTMLVTRLGAWGKSGAPARLWEWTESPRR